MKFLLLAPLAVAATAQTTPSSATSSASTPAVTALNDCHLHGLVQYCMPKPGDKEVAVTTASDSAAASALPTAYNNCHFHGSEFFCVDPSSEDVPIEVLSAAHSDGDHDDDHASHDDEAKSEDSSSGGENCHFHAGVEHCTGGAGSSAASALSDACARRDRTYNIPLRVGSIFVVLCTSGIAVFLPLLLRRFAHITSTSLAFTIIKQFGTGVIIATAFVHLLTHATLMFSNPCVGELAYEATTTAVTMAGLFVAAVVEYSGHRFIAYRAELCAPVSAEESGSSSVASKEDTHAATGNLGCHASTPANDKLSVLVMEMGIIFHSILIGVTLVVAGDSVFTTLLIVISFHQAFEGLALGARISALAPITSLDFTKLGLAVLFSAITPIGMAIGIGVRNYFNGSDRETLIALGTLDALSAGILVWVGLVEMLASDWLFGDLRRARMGRTLVAGASLISGMVLMGLLGKWA